MYNGMPPDTIRYVRIENSLAKVIDDHIKKFTRFGAQIYQSRSDFAREACSRLLETEIKHTNKEVTA